MPNLEIPGYGRLQLDHLVMDFNGTLAVDGRLWTGVHERLEQLSLTMGLHVVTADTHGSARQALGQVPCQLHILPPEGQAEAKSAHVRQLGAGRTAAIGNGRNDRLMLKQAALGIGVILNEGAFSPTLVDADLICTSILDALDLLRFPLRLTATLRS